MLKNWFNRSLLLTSFLFSAGALADGDHHHSKGPHGGEVATFGQEYHLEAVMVGNKVAFYILDEKSAATAIKQVTGGSVIIISPGKGQVKTEIQKADELKEFSAKSPGEGKMTAVVKLSAQGKELMAKFNMAH